MFRSQRRRRACAWWRGGHDQGLEEYEAAFRDAGYTRAWWFVDDRAMGAAQASRPHWS